MKWIITHAKMMTKNCKMHVLCSRHQERQCHADFYDLWCSILLSSRLVPDEKGKTQEMAKTSFCFICPIFWYCFKEDFSGRCYLFCSHVIPKIYKKYSVKTSSEKKKDYKTNLNMKLIIFNCFSKRTVLLITVYFCKASLRCGLQNRVDKLSQHVCGLGRYY